ncbi:MAG: pyridoxamine 5'-phosphate oxidase [Chitinophagaceae bacterium]
MKIGIASIRKEYQLQTLNETDVSENAIEQFSRWWNDAIRSNILEANAMTLATATKTGTPSARIVLLKGFNENGFIFFTNYNSKKGKELEENPKAALIFFWKEIERQIRIEGNVEKLSANDSDEYFNSRPVGSRIGAWASPQSHTIKSRQIIEHNAEKYIHEFKDGIPRPPHWGGYIVKPASIEFWQGRSNRLHDRILYTKIESGKWKIERLAP